MARSNLSVVAMREELRQDTVWLRLFLEAECRLVHDLGVSNRLITRLREDLAATIHGEPGDVRQLRGRLDLVIESLNEELARLASDNRHSFVINKLVGVVEALGTEMVSRGARRALG